MGRVVELLPVLVLGLTVGETAEELVVVVLVEGV